jgi:DNA-binding helix-hairpin-helix protein with protein kinase domain
LLPCYYSPIVSHNSANGYIPLKYLAHTQLYEKKFPGITRENIVNLMINLIDTVSKLHELEVYLGDINLENVLCDSTTWNVSLIDADSYQVGDYPCPVGRPEMTPLEHHGKDFSSVKRTKESDCFSLAILMFHCFMLGRHPYDNIGGGNPVENLEKGRFPYGTGGMAPGRDGAIPPGNWYNLWSHLSFKLKSLFIKTFKDGASDPSSRASLSEWKTALQDYSYNIKSGYNTNEVFPRTPKSSDPQ